MLTRSSLVLQTPPTKQCPVQQPILPSPGAARSRAMDRARNGRISYASTPMEQRIANARISISDRHFVATPCTHASTSVELDRQCANPERMWAEVGPRVSKGKRANGETLASGRPKPARVVTFFVVELACILCSREVGVFQSATWPAPMTVQISQAAAAPRIVADWRQLRCENCGGSILPSDIERRTVRIESRIDWESDKPRRGRPPKWLADQRSRAGVR